MPTRRAVLPACLVLALALAGPASARPIVSGAAASEPQFAARDLFADTLWDDGRAEISVYTGTIERYGVVRPLSVRNFVVKEDMDSIQGVKSSVGPVEGRTREVLKQNFIRDFPTGTYDYHQMCSTFLDRATGRLVKLAMSSTEGCGVTFVEIRPAASGFERVSHSYFDGEADRTEAIAVPEGRPLLPADALPLWLRRLDLSREQFFEVDVLTSQLSNRVTRSRVLRRTILVAGRADRYGLPVTVGGSDLRVPDANDPAAVREEARVDRYWFDPAWPHPLVRFEGGSDPTMFTRVKTIRLAYWEKTAPGDEKLLEP